MVTFEGAYVSIPGDGWLTVEEARLLWKFASQFTGPILEVGCFKGRSTCLLAQLGRPLVCVDPFKGFHTDDPDGSKTRAAWYENVLTKYTNVLLFEGRIEEWQPVGIDFAYLDGDHTYNGTVCQILAAQTAKAKGIAVHDVNDSGGGTEVKRACLELLGPWDERVERLAVWTIRPEQSQ